MSDSEKLTNLADWFDKTDADKEATEVQQDLRRMATRLLELEKSENQIEEAKREAWEEACEAYEDRLFEQGLERPLNKPHNPYSKPEGS